MQYYEWIKAVCSLLEYPIPTDADAATAEPTDVDAFNAIIPRAIDYTELRIQRDLDLIATTVTATGTMIANQRLQTLPQVNIPAVEQIPELLGTPIPPGSTLTTTLGSMDVNVEWTAHGRTAGEQVSILTPVVVGGLTLGGVYSVITVVDADNFTINAAFEATSSASAVVIGNGIYIVTTQMRLIIAGVKQPPMEFVTRDYLDYAWPDDASISGATPMQWAQNDQATVLVGPAPGTALGFESVGTMRIPQLSVTNYVNYLSSQFPDLYLAASMCFFANYQRDTSSTGEGLVQMWEATYQTQLKSAVVEEARKNFANMFPSPSNPAGLTAKSQGG